METLVALNVTPITTPHRDLDYLPLADKYFQIKDLEPDKDPLKVFCQFRDNYMNGSDTIGLWESNLPMYILPSVHIFLNIIHQCQANYNPNLRAIIPPIKLFSSQLLQTQTMKCYSSISFGNYLKSPPKCLVLNSAVIAPLS